jgi:hypothetical protein
VLCNSSELISQLRHGDAPATIIKHFGILGSWIFGTTVSNVLALSRARCRSLRNICDPGAVAELCLGFHSLAGTLTPAVRRSIDDIAAGRQWIRLGHQPNFAAYLKLVGLFSAAEETAHLHNSVPVFLLNDCDTVNDDRFRRAVLPDITHPRGGRYISISTRGIPSATVAFRASIPSRDWLTNVCRIIRDNAAVEDRLNKSSHLRSTTEDIVGDLAFAWHNADTVAAMTSILLSRLVNIRLGLATAFVPGHRLWAHIGGHQATVDLFSNWADVASAQLRVASELEHLGIDLKAGWLVDAERVPLWWVCDCGCRVNIRFTERLTMMRGQCEACRRRVSERSAEVLQLISAGRLIPRVNALDLVENMAAEILGGISYVSSGSHSLVNGLVAHSLGIDVMPQVFVDLKGNFGTTFERMRAWREKSRSGLAVSPAADWITAGRASAIYYVTRCGAQHLSNSIRRWTRLQYLDEELNVTSE